MPAVIAFIFSSSTRSALARASAWAATIRSSAISFSSAFISDGSMTIPFIAPLALKITRTMPPPDWPSTSMWSSSACASCSLACMAWACFINPMRSGMSVKLLKIVLTERNVAIGDVVVDGRRAGLRRIAWRVRPAHIDDLGAGEALQHLLHQRMRGDAAQALLLLGLGDFAQSRRFRAGDESDHPALARPFLQAASERLGDLRRGALDQREGDAARLETREAHVALQGGLQLNVALRARQRDDVLEPGESWPRRSRRLRRRGRRRPRLGAQGGAGAAGGAARRGERRNRRPVAALGELAQSLFRRRQIGGVGQA